MFATMQHALCQYFGNHSENMENAENRKKTVLLTFFNSSGDLCSWVLHPMPGPNEVDPVLSGFAKLIAHGAAASSTHPASQVG